MSLKKEKGKSATLERRSRCGVVGNPALCPAFRVRRGRGQENGFAASRARRATRPTPERVSVPCGHGADISSRQRAWGHAAARFAPRPPATLGRAGRAWEPARESGGGADRLDGNGGRARGRNGKHPTRAGLQQATSSAQQVIQRIVEERDSSAGRPACNAIHGCATKKKAAPKSGPAVTARCAQNTRLPVLLALLSRSGVICPAAPAVTAIPPHVGRSAADEQPDRLRHYPVSRHGKNICPHSG